MWRASSVVLAAEALAPPRSPEASFASSFVTTTPATTPTQRTSPQPSLPSSPLQQLQQLPRRPAATTIQPPALALARRPDDDGLLGPVYAGECLADAALGSNSSCSSGGDVAPAAASRAAAGSGTVTIGASARQTSIPPIYSTAVAAAEAAAAAANAAEVFARDLPRPDTYGSPPRRDFIGWVARLLEPAHLERWLRLCAAFRLRHRCGIADPEVADAEQRAITNAIIEHVVLPLKDGETRRVLTTSQRRHIKRTAESGLNFTHVFDFFLALFDLAEALHGSSIAALAGDACGPDSMVTTTTNCSTEVSMVGGRMTRRPEPSFLDLLVVKYHFNNAVDRFRAVFQAVETNHQVRDFIVRTTDDMAWANNYVAKCVLDRGQARVIHLVLVKGSSQEDESSVIRSHFTVFVENDPLVFAAALSTLDPERAILVADRHVGLNVGRDSLSFSPHGARFVLSPGRSASNIRKLLYADALLQRFKNGTLSQESFMHLAQKLVMLNSGHDAPGSTWAAPWPNWPALDPAEKEALELGAKRGNIVAGALLAALILANHMLGIGTWTTGEFLGAVEELKRITELGDAAAPSYLGRFLSEPGSMRNIPEAIRFSRIAVERGQKNAPAFLAQLLLRNGGDPVESVELFRKCIARGGRHAHRPLAELLSVGAPGVPRDVVEAHRLLEEAARLGDPDACRMIAAHEV